MILKLLADFQWRLFRYTMFMFKLPHNKVRITFSFIECIETTRICWFSVYSRYSTFKWWQHLPHYIFPIPFEKYFAKHDLYPKLPQEQPVCSIQSISREVFGYEVKMSCVLRRLNYAFAGWFSGLSATNDLPLSNLQLIFDLRRLV